MHQSDPIKTFVCYAHEDRDTVEAIKKQLVVFEKQQLLQVWSDGQIKPGEKWDEVIKTRLEQSQLILLFVSVDFLNSDYIEHTELQMALQRHEAELAVLVPIIVRSCHWKDYFDIGKFQALPKGGHPILSGHFKYPDDAHFEVSGGLKIVAEELRQKNLAATAAQRAAAEQAEQAILTQAEDNAAWEAALEAADDATTADEKIAALNTYLRQRPTGQHAEDAREKIKEARAAEAKRHAKVQANEARERAKAFKQKHDSALTFEKGGLLTEAVALLQELLPLHEEGFVSSPAELEGRLKVLEARLGPPPPADFVLVKGGTFEMGDVLGDKEFENEQVHTVTVDDFYLAKYALTFDEYDAFCAATQREKPDDRKWGRGKRPVINVSWFDAVAYCNWRSQQEKRREVYSIENETVTLNSGAIGYRLPTEAEWEYAAREGGQKVRFCNSRNEIKPSEINFDASKDYKKPYSEVGMYREKTVLVGELSANVLSLYQMSGNVWEWCWDWYDADFYNQSNGAHNPTGPAEGADRVQRGGSWYSNPENCRVARRDCDDPTSRKNNVGVRLALPFAGR